MSDIADDDLKDDINNALEDENIDDNADNGKDDIEEDADLEEKSDDIEEDDDQDENHDRKTSGKGTDRSASADDTDLEDDDDDLSIDYARPEFGNGSEPQVGQPFDIRTLPKDPETGLIDPVEANRLINEHAAKQGKVTTETQARTEQTKELLTQQWVRVSKKFPAVYNSPRLRDLARNLHLNSIGTDKYLTPAQAASKIERTRREFVKTGYKSAKTRRSVEKMTRTERASVRTSDTTLSDYEKAKKMASSRDKQTAKEGRMTMLRLRREAQRR